MTASRPLRAAGTEDLLRAIGRRVREARRAGGMTQSQLAQTSGVSKRMLALVENGTGNASLATLSKIAAGLAVPFSQLAAGVRSASDDRVVHADDAEAIYRSDTGSYGSLLVAAAQAGPAELWDWLLVPGDTYHAEPDPAGSEELIQVRVGTLDVQIGGNNHRLDVDDALRIQSDQPYSFTNPGLSPVRFIKIVVPTG